MSSGQEKSVPAGIMEDFSVASYSGHEPTLVLGIRVPYSYYIVYIRLSKEERDFIRDAMKQFFIGLVKNIKKVNYGVSVNANNNVNINLVLNVNNVQSVSNSKEREEADVFTVERVKQLKEKLREAQEVLQDYKVKAQKYDEIRHYVKLYKQNTIDVKTLLQKLTQLVER